jgi:hypothetical protein
MEHTIKSLFRALQSDSDTDSELLVTAIYFEILHASVRDLILPDNNDLKVKAEKRFGPRVTGAAKVKVTGLVICGVLNYSFFFVEFF